MTMYYPAIYNPANGHYEFNYDDACCTLTELAEDYSKRNDGELPPSDYPVVTIVTTKSVSTYGALRAKLEAAGFNKP